MAIQAINANQSYVKRSNNLSSNAMKNNVAFKSDEAETFEKETKKEASTGKKWGVGIASAICTGLGQAVNGQWGKAAAFFFGGLAAGLLSRRITLFPALGISIWSIVDAVKNAKPDAE